MPTLAITLGDPAGVGPEVSERAVAAWKSEAAGVEVVLVGPEGIVEPMAERLGPGVRAVVGPGFSGPVGAPSKESGAAALWALSHAIDAAKAGTVQGIVTAPLSKTALALAGSGDPGHTEILARALGTGPVAMAFAAPTLKVALVTTHIALSAVPRAVTSERVLAVARLFRKSLAEDFGIVKPRLALAGLNPHAGEGGMFGDEEARHLAPAVIGARGEGIDLNGPLPSDTLFFRATQGEFDGVVALYHDQGLIPVKLLAFGQAVNYTLGLSTIRTSPDHGTAYDKMGTPHVDPAGMTAALRLAAAMVRRRAAR